MFLLSAVPFGLGFGVVLPVLQATAFAGLSIVTILPLVSFSPSVGPVSARRGGEELAAPGGVARADRRPGHSYLSRAFTAPLIRPKYVNPWGALAG